MVSSAVAAVTVGNVTDLVNAVNIANSGVGDKTILIADGTYNMSGQALYITADGITVRSASGNREKVLLDSHYTQSGTSGVIRIVSSNITIADITLQHQYFHSIHISASTRDISNININNVHIIDPGEQAIKINADSVHGASYRAYNGTIAGCLIELTDSGRAELTNTEYPCYTGGVDGHWSVNWTIRDNIIRGFWCSGGLSEHGIHMWNHSDNTLVERNLIINCDRGIGFGLGTDRGNNGGIIRNNMVYHGPNTGYSDVGISLESTPDAQVYNNSIFHEHNYSAIEYRFESTANSSIINNLTNRAITIRDINPEGDTNEVSNNITTAQTSWFADVPSGDLHLSGNISSVVGKGQAVAGLSDDFDGDSRPQGNGYEIGADELAAPPPPMPSDSAVLTWNLLLLQDD